MESLFITQTLLFITLFCPHPPTDCSLKQALPIYYHTPCGSTKTWNPESGNGNGITETETETEYGISERRFQAIDLKKKILAMTIK